MAYTRRMMRGGGLDAGTVTRDSDGATIPNDPGNVDWQAYSAWLAQGNAATVPAWTAPARGATGKQLGAALADLGCLAAFDAALGAAAKPEDRYYWQASYRCAIPENSPKLARLVAQAVAAGATLTVSALFDKAVDEPAT